jgi:K+-sensing histidine kinase KdpD
MRRNLLQELAHDLRTPIASMKSLLESLQFQGEKMSKAQTQENLKLALTEVDYFHHLVEDLLFLSGVHDLKFRAKFSHVNLVDIIQHEVQVANETNAIKIKFASDEFYEIEGNNFLIQRLIKNAISNAVANARNQVAISLEENDNKLSLYIDDDGPGLSKEDIESFGQKRATRKIYEEQVNNKISVGLGAVIMQKICDIHSAQMKISNIATRENHNHGASLKFSFALLRK